MDLTNKHRPLICVDPTKTGGNLQIQRQIWSGMSMFETTRISYDIVWYSHIYIVYIYYIIYIVCVERAEVKPAKHGADSSTVVKQD